MKKISLSRSKKAFGRVFGQKCFLKAQMFLKTHITKLLMGLLALLILFLILFFRFFQDVSVRTPAQGGVYTHGVVSELKELSPLAQNATKADKILHTLLYKGLLRYNPQTGFYEDDLGEFQVSEDQTRYTVRLKSSAKFSNGDPVTVQDVLFTFKDVIQNENFPNQSLSKSFQYVTIAQKDEQTVVFEIPEPYFYFPALLTTPILHAASFEGAFLGEILDSEFPGNKKPVSTGFFRLRSIIPESNGTLRVFLDANTHSSPQPNLRQMVLSVYPTFSHMETETTPKTGYQVQKSALQKEYQAFIDTNYRPVPYVLPRWTGLFFQLDQYFMRRDSIRQALALTTPKADLAEENWGTIDSPFFFEGVVGTSVYDPARARALLNENGLRFDEDTQKRVDSEGKTVKLTLLTSTRPSFYSVVGQKLKREWERELNLAIDFQVLPPAEFDVALQARKYDMVLFGTDFGTNPDTLGLWHSSKSGNLNFSNLTNPKVDERIKNIHQNGHQEDLFKLASLLDDIVPALPLVTPTYTLQIAPELLGTSARIIKPRTHADWFLEIHDWYLQTEKSWPDDIAKRPFGAFWQWIWTKAENKEGKQENEAQ